MSYGRFYALLGKLQTLDGSATKETLVYDFTGGRTEHLHELSPSEYEALCERLEDLSGERDRLRKLRGVCLRLMSELEIDTQDWDRVNAFCENNRIAGRPFGMLNAAGLVALQKKLRCILKHGGLKKEVSAPTMQLLPPWAVSISL